VSLDTVAFASGTPSGSKVNHVLLKEGKAGWFREYAPKDRESEPPEVEAKETKRDCEATRIRLSCGNAGDRL
jgi:hypothetical protein